MFQAPSYFHKLPLTICSSSTSHSLKNALFCHLNPKYLFSMKFQFFHSYHFIFIFLSFLISSPTPSENKIVFPVLSLSCVTHSLILLNLICLHLLLTSGWSPLAPWPCAPAAEIWNPVPRWCSRCFAWYLHGSGCMSPVATTQHFSLIFS